MNLDETQKQQVTAWIEQGLKISEIQKRMAEELNLKLTYMEVRFLMDDLQLKPKDPEPPKEPEPAAAKPDTGSKAGAPGEADGAAEPLSDDESVPGDVSVRVDQITRPGAVVSGQVTFSDGKQASWYLDQVGRLGIVPPEPGYKPSQGDIMIFEGELQKALQKLGM